MMILVTGGSGSGKSAFAEDCVVSFGKTDRIYIATMYPFDEESRKRVQRHRKMRQGKGFETVEVKQHSSVLHQPTKLLQEAILERKFSYDGSKLYEINFQNARCTEDNNLNKYVNKKKSNGKVDMVVSTIIAIYLLQQNMLSDDDFVIQT